MENSHRTDADWLSKVRFWHSQFGIPLPATFPSGEKMRDAAADLYSALHDALTVVEAELYRAKGAYGKNYSDGRTEKLQKIHDKGLAAIARATRGAR